jgi:hypothetical protein
MTEHEWLECTDLHRMLGFLAERVSNRKLQLFESACQRRIPARAAIRWEQLRRGGNLSEESAQRRLGPNVRKELVQAIIEADKAITIATCSVRRKADQRDAAIDERVAQCKLLREIVGNPFRPVAIDTSWLTWNDGTAVKIAQGIHEQRAFDRLVVLADALEEAGCTEAAILEHLRGPGPHVRGCWAVDLLLGKT